MTDKFLRFSHIIHTTNPPGTLSVMYVETGLPPLHVNLHVPLPGVDLKSYIESHWPHDLFDQMRAAGVTDAAPQHLRNVLGQRFDHSDLVHPAAAAKPVPSPSGPTTLEEM